jgi:DNA-binding ferritin-like protein
MKPPECCGSNNPHMLRLEGIGAGERSVVIDAAEKRGQIIRRLEEALALADELDDGGTGYLIERALDEARSRQFRPASDKN